MKKRELIMRVPDPFDGSANVRLAHMGLVDTAGKLPPGTLSVLTQLYAGLFFDELFDFYDDQNIIFKICEAFRELAEKRDYSHMLLLLSLQYDYMRKPLPDPIWWLSGRSDAVEKFMSGFYVRLSAMMNDALVEHVKQEGRQ